MNSIQELTDKFLQIKAKGFVPNTRPNNKDGGIGNTLEDLLGIQENNLTQADFKDIEIKSQRLFNSSYISLFTKSFSQPRAVNTRLRETYGEIRMEEHPDKPVLNTSLFGNRESLVYEKYKISLLIKRDLERIYLIVKDLNGNILCNDVYWDFSILRNASRKLNKLLLVFADTQTQNNQKYHHFTKAQLYLNFDFNKFLDELEQGNIMVDIRIGVHNSGPLYGRTHDHGNAFRIKKENFYKLYSIFKTIE